MITSGSFELLLLWIAPSSPDDEGETAFQGPQFVTRAMLESLRPYVDDIVEVVMPGNETGGMMFAPLDGLAAQDAMGVAAHRAAAEALRGPVLYCSE